MKKFILCCLVFLTFTGCGTYYLEKNSEALSQAVYASKDSIEVARLDLTDMYVSQAARIIVPPKHRITISAVYKKGTVGTSTLASSNSKGQRILVVPEKYKNDKVVVVNSQEYAELLKAVEINAQLEKDKLNLKEHIVVVDTQLANNEKITNELILSNQKLKEDVSKKETTIAKQGGTIFKLWTALVSLVLLIAAYFYIKIYTRISLPF